MKESPKHLNALADLETIFRNLYLITDADRGRRTIDSILKSTNDADVQIKRMCFLEQGYAILIEQTIVNENTLVLWISDIHNILTDEYHKSDGERREYLGRGLYHQKEVLGSIHNANKDNTTDAHLPDPLWDHYYPKALKSIL